MKIKLTLVIAILFYNVLFAQQSDKIISQQVDSLLIDVFAKGKFSGQVMISHHGKSIYYKEYGYADWKTKRGFDKNTLFNIGSLNKQFTKEIIHQLVAENQVSYNDPINKYLDLFPIEIGSRITIQQLLDMKTGLGDYLQSPKFEKFQFKDFSLAELIDIIKEEPLLFEPGTSQRYSNSGYVVLGALIEKITNQSYQKNLFERITKPLGLQNVYYSKTEKAKQNNRAYGTEVTYDGNKICFDDISNSTPAGGIYMNIVDLLKFTETKLKSALPSGKKYGGAIEAGGTPIWNSVIYYNVKNGYAFVVMANMGKIADQLAPRINSIIKGEPYQPPVELPFNLLFEKIINEKGFDYVKTNLKELAQQAKLPYDDHFLNFFGYEFLEENKGDMAIGLFKINVELFPNITNSYDSLAEAYLKTADKVNALKYYKMVLELEPNNQKVREIISNLENGK